MSTLNYKSEIKRLLAGGETTGLVTSTTLALGTIQQRVTWLETGTGTGDRECPKQGIRQYLAETGNQTLSLGAFPDGAGGTLSFANLRYLAITNLATNSAHALTVGGAGSNPFFAAGLPLEDATDTKVIQPGATLIIVFKPLGAGVTVGTAVNLLMAAGANTFDWVVDAKGY
jgi:hypothetical protein